MMSLDKYNIVMLSVDVVLNQEVNLTLGQQCYPSERLGKSKQLPNVSESKQLQQYQHIDVCFKSRIQHIDLTVCIRMLV